MDNNTYIPILLDTLIKKKNLLDSLLNITTSQEKYINEQIPDMDLFDQTLIEKENIITKINQLDEGFEKIYTYVQEELIRRQIEHKEQIEALQSLIRQITDKSTKIQALELRNKVKLDAYFQMKKKEIKNFKTSSQTVSNYYKNMNNQYEGNSYFLDKKK